MKRKKKKELISTTSKFLLGLSNSKAANLIGKRRLLRLILRKERNFIVKIKSQKEKSSKRKMRKKLR